MKLGTWHLPLDSCSRDAQLHDAFDNQNPGHERNDCCLLLQTDENCNNYIIIAAAV